MQVGVSNKPVRSVDQSANKWLGPVVRYGMLMSITIPSQPGDIHIRHLANVAIVNYYNQ